MKVPHAIVLQSLNMLKENAPAYETSRGLLQTLNDHLSFTKFQNDRVQAADPASGEVAMLVQVNQAGALSMQRVTIGAPHSGGTGFRALRVPNG